jgi:hypothetical protein
LPLLLMMMLLLLLQMLEGAGAESPAMALGAAPTSVW